MKKRRPHPPLEQRFWTKVRKSEGDGCWEWTAATNGYGYGLITMRPARSPALAHRVSYELAKGPIPAGLFVCHSCDNPLCVRPDHLWLGTRSDNMRDMVSKGRQPAHLRSKSERLNMTA